MSEDYMFLSCTTKGNRWMDRFTKYNVAVWTYNYTWTCEQHASYKMCEETSRRVQHQGMKLATCECTGEVEVYKYLFLIIAW